ncbi:hypothetical protein HZI73_26160 (plasmid) [Vallitalea pronyensis]|uniref:Uncharacterized protein n=1 Tax=Vallitalea pronyensis TaxID=1348613 RepID=A0A8J8MQL3_9FIRM|nr:hypothetical protein [Vallitalea pronyensis]QUI25899.1 hypothetical protein HZI73_26160 [Vallitalea pronyensis]
MKTTNVNVTVTKDMIIDILIDAAISPDKVIRCEKKKEILAIIKNDFVLIAKEEGKDIHVITVENYKYDKKVNWWKRQEGDKNENQNIKKNYKLINKYDNTHIF